MMNRDGRSRCGTFDIGDIKEVDMPTCHVAEAGYHGEDTEVTAELSEVRGEYYRTLSAVFGAEPNEQTLSSFIHSANTPEVLNAAPEAEKELLSAIREVFGGENTDTETGSIDRDITRIRSEYAALFVGPRHKLAAPFESVYVGERHRMFSDVTRDVRTFYERNGFVVAKKNTVPDDFISYELEFMSHLCDEISNAAREDRTAFRRILETQQEFLQEHLLVWVPSFSKAIIDSGCSDYYAAWARFLNSYVQDDRGAVGSLLAG